MSKIKTVIDLVDRKRRDCVQVRNKAEGPVMYMYFEGQRVALQETQELLEKFDALPNVQGL